MLTELSKTCASSSNVHPLVSTAHLYQIKASNRSHPTKNYRTINGLLQRFGTTYEYIVVSHIFQCDRGSKGVNKLGIDQPEYPRNGMRSYAENTAGKAGNCHTFGSSRGI